MQAALHSGRSPDLNQFRRAKVSRHSRRPHPGLGSDGCRTDRPRQSDKCFSPRLPMASHPSEGCRVPPTKSLSCPVDVSKSNSGSNNSATSGSATTTAANTVLFAAGISSSTYGNATNEFTTRVLTQPKMGGLPSTGTGIFADRIVNTVGTYEATAPVSGGGTWLMQLVAFRDVS
jgi:hypothetical protein